MAVIRNRGCSWTLRSAEAVPGMGASFWGVCHFRAFRSCGEAEVLDTGGVVAGQVALAAVAVLVVPHVVVEVAVNDDGAELEDDLGAVRGPSGPGDPESVLDDEAACSLDHAGGDWPSLFECLVVAHVLVVVREIGDGLVHVGEVEVTSAGAGAGLRRRPCRTRSSCPSAHCPAAGPPGRSAAAALPM